MNESITLMVLVGGSLLAFIVALCIAFTTLFTPSEDENRE